MALKFSREFLLAIHPFEHSLLLFSTQFLTKKIFLMFKDTLDEKETTFFTSLFSLISVVLLPTFINLLLPPHQAFWKIQISFCSKISTDLSKSFRNCHKFDGKVRKENCKRGISIMKRLACLEVCVWVCVWGEVCVCLCVCVRERERERALINRKRFILSMRISQEKI
jgi:hypothetical protein